MKAVISASLGGKPVRSNTARRSSTYRSASGFGFNPAVSIRVKIKRSRSLFAQLESFTAGGAALMIGLNDQGRWSFVSMEGFAARTAAEIVLSAGEGLESSAF